MKIVLNCLECANDDFEINEYGTYARCTNCGRDIYLQSLDTDYNFEEKKEGDK